MICAAAQGCQVSGAGASPVPPQLQLKVSVLLFNLSDSRPAKLTTPLNKVKRLSQLCLDSPLMCAENIPRPALTPSHLANSLPQAELLALMPFPIGCTPN